MDMAVVRNALAVLAYGVLLGASGTAFLMSAILLLLGGGIGTGE